MPVYRFAYKGQPLEIEAENKMRAVSKARLAVARDVMTAQATMGAKNRSSGLDDPLSPQFRDLRERAEMEGTAAAAGPTATILGSAALMPVITGGLGAVAGATRAVPVLGAAVNAATSRPGAAVVGGLEEGIRTGDPVEAAKGALLGFALGRSGGKAGRVLSAVKQAETAAASAAAPAAASEAGVVAAEADDIVTAALRMRNENKLSGAQIISALKQSYGVPVKDGRKLVQGILDAEKGAGAVSPLRVPRIEEGAQKVGRAAGMTKEEVRVATGPVLGEAVGEASPILPKKALQSIIDKMKSLPVAEREAYVRLAKDPKAMAQIENVRRTLEHLGLSVPVWMAAAIVGSQMAGATEGGS